MDDTRTRCPWCAKILSRKYLYNHKRKYCPKRNKRTSTSTPVKKIEETTRRSAYEDPLKRKRPKTFNIDRTPWRENGTTVRNECLHLKKGCDCRICIPDIPAPVRDGPWYHKCEKCERSFRCVPPRPTKFDHMPPLNRACRCIEWCNGTSLFCSNSCFWDAMNAAGPSEAYVWCM